MRVDFLRKSKTEVAILLVLFFILLVRATSDHSNTTHYTGDSPSEKDLITASENFYQFGFSKLKFMPVQDKLLSEKDFPLAPKLYYTHFAPIHYWLFGGGYILGHRDLFIARLFAIIITVFGVWFGALALRRVSQELGGGTLPLWPFLIVLSTTPLAAAAA
jgi:hypothetical protein